MKPMTIVLILERDYLSLPDDSEQEGVDSEGPLSAVQTFIFPGHLTYEEAVASAVDSINADTVANWDALPDKENGPRPEDVPSLLSVAELKENFFVNARYISA